MDDRLVIDPERYELSEPAPYHFDLARRDFLRVLTAMGGGLLVVAALPDAAEARQGSGRRFQGRSTPGELAAWLHIDANGRVTVYTGKVEIGQNIRTSLAQAVGDELGLPLSSISLVMADTDRTPFDQGTFGSRTTPTMAPILSKAAATAREMLVGRAADAWHVDRATLHVADGAVVGPGGRSMSYGEITRGQALTGVISAEPTPADHWTLRGTPAHKVNGPEIVTGRHAYPSDIQRPNLLIGRVIRPPSYGATPRSVDESTVRTMAGVRVIRDGDFIGVVAPNERVAKRAEQRLKVDWTTSSNPQTSETVYEHLKKTARAGGRGGTPRIVGDVNRARAGAAKVLEASYRIPYIAHVPLEPRAAVAEWTNGKVTVWTGTQRPFGVRTQVAQAFHLTEDQVRVMVPDMGSGYGGKHTGEAAVEAARLARAAGRPVKLVYTRAEEFMWGYFRPAGVIDVRAGVDAAGHLVLWEFDNYNSGGSALNAPYTIPNRREAFHSADSPLRQGSYRGLAATANHYVREMHIDAVARAVGTDAVEFRLAHLDDPRLRAVLTTAARKAGWPKPSRPGRAMGVACGVEKGGYVATVAEVSRANGNAGGRTGTDGHQAFMVDHLTVVFECGAIVNPDGLRNQVEGAVIQGLGGALFEAIRFANGQILNGTMADYRVPRFKDVPPIDVVLLDRKDLPSAGAGETPIVCVAPAIGSALRAFGTVDTALPIALQ